MPASQLPVPQTYAALRRAVETVVLKGRQAIDDAWLRTYHDTGQLIHEHLLKHQERASYGAEVFAKLAGDTEISTRTLHECVQFYRAFPIVRARAQLGWGHYRILMQVTDAAERDRLFNETQKQNWTSRELQTQVRTVNARADESSEVSPGLPGDGSPQLLTPRRGTPGISKVVATDDGLATDLGFACYVDLPADTELQAGAFVQLDALGRARPVADATKSDLFTYPATVLKLVDGDTLWVKIHVGQRYWLKQKLRLRDLDCPEMSTPEGKAARRFVEALLSRTKAVTICTTKPDKYDRYLADIFLEGDFSQLPALNSQPAATPLYLNNALLTAGHAVIKRAWEFGDWGQ